MVTSELLLKRLTTPTLNKAYTKVVLEGVTGEARFLTSKTMDDRDKHISYYFLGTDRGENPSTVGKYLKKVINSCPDKTCQLKNLQSDS